MKKLVGGVVIVVAGGLAAVLALVVVVAGAIAETDAESSCGGPVGGSGPTLAAAAAQTAGFRRQDLLVAVAVAGAESSYQPDARNSSGASGLWQILQSAHPNLFARYDWRDPAANAAMAHSVWHAAGDSWTPWTTWTSGAYRDHLTEAQTAIDGLGDSTSPAAGNAGTMCPQGGSTPGEAAQPFTGPDGYVDDPTSGGRITRRMLHTFNEINRVFGGWHWGVGCWDRHAWNPTSDHPLGRACDLTVGRLGEFPNDADRAVGWQLAHWLQANAEQLGVSYIIWQGRIWSAARADDGWRPYSGGGIYNVHDPTGGHYDHVHVSVD